MLHEPVAGSIGNTIRYLSELLPVEPVVLGTVVDERADLVWCGDDAHRLMSSERIAGASTIRAFSLGSSVEVSSIALADSLTPGDSQVRLGFLFVTGTLSIDGESTPVCFPLLSRRIDLRFDPQQTTEVTATAAGDLEVTALIRRTATRHELLRTAPLAVPSVFSDRDSELFAMTAAWVARACEVLEISVSGIGDSAIHPFDALQSSADASADPVVLPGYGLYLDASTAPPTTAESIAAWADLPSIGTTALSTLIRPDLSRPISGGDSSTDPLPMTVLPLDAQQERIVQLARTRPMLTLTGAPGTGKSRTVAALALDAVRTDRTVLLATKTHSALEVLRDFFESMPGPDPVLFGSGQSAGDMADRLERCLKTRAEGHGVDSPHDPFTADTSVRDAMSQLNTAHAAAMRQFGAWFPDPRGETIDEVARRAPGLVHEDHRLRAVALRDELDAWNPRRRRRAVAEFISVCEPVDGDLKTALEALDIANIRVLSGVVTETFPPGEMLQSVIDLQHTARRSIGDAAVVNVQQRIRASNREQMHLLVQALRSTASTRREILGRIDAKQVLNAEPIWLGTLQEIDEFLPATAGLFDLVILDEASQIEIPLAVPALGRAKAAVIVGDPRQMRYTSHVGGPELEEVANRHHLDGPTRSRFDVRLNSVFDCAAAIAPPTTLRTHYRSQLHIIDFPARRFYGGEVDVATRHPCNEGVDAITEIVVDGGEQGSDGVNNREVDAVAAVVADKRDRIEPGSNQTIGVVTPFPAQADAIAARLTEDFTPAELVQLGMEIGTVDAFQGTERDTMILSLAVSPSSTSAAKLFVNDPNVFNVMITRARYENIVLTSYPSPPDGLMGDYLRAGAVAPNLPPPEPISDEWVDVLAEEFELAGVEVQRGYRVGRHVIDLVIGSGTAALGLDCAPHRNGTAVQLEQRLELHQLGWTILDVPEGEWSMRRAQLVSDILRRL